MGWTLLVFLVYDSLFSCVAAFAPDEQLALVTATPFLTIFMLLNGFVVSPGGAPGWISWLFNVSPNFYTMQSILTVVAEHDGEAAMSMMDIFGYKTGQESKALCVLLSVIVCLRILQVLALKFFNNIQR